MRLINIEAFLEREEGMSEGGRVDRRSKVLDFCDDETTAYAILSHRWNDPTEVDYDEMVDLAKMGQQERDEIRGRLGYEKIWGACRQAKRDGYQWLWADTCCIDKRSSAELSEAINSMYRWYRNAQVCYAYLHDVADPSFPTEPNTRRYCDSNGWPEWFSRGWTLQEMIAPRDVQFFGKDWQHIGDKKTLTRTLKQITGVPDHILKGGLSGTRPCVAQIISWAANRITTRLEDRAYSLMGLLDVNMPMLYGEGKKAFHRLQLEIIRTSNDRSIFAWGCKGGNVQTGSILADDPSFFGTCSSMVLMDHTQYIESLNRRIPAEELPLIDEDYLGTFPITNRGIQIWMLLHPYRNSNSLFKAYLPCHSGTMVTIDLALWDSNYYRYSSVSQEPLQGPLQFRQVYLRYQDTYHDVTFDIDDSAMSKDGFTCHDVYPWQLTGRTPTLTGASPLSTRVYSNKNDNLRFMVAFGQCFDQGWVHAAVSNLTGGLSRFYKQELVKGPEHARFMAEAPPRGECHGRVWVNHIRLPGSTWIVRISRVMWERSRVGVRIEAFDLPFRIFNISLDQWKILDVEVGVSFVVHVLLLYDIMW